MNTLKKWLALTLLSLATLQLSAFQINEEPVGFENLPQNARFFIEQFFDHVTITRAAHDRRFVEKSYEVALSDNTLIEFDEEGEWTTIQCEYSAVPSSLIPFAIKEYVRIAYPEAKINKIERGIFGYRILLSSHLKLNFDSQGNITNTEPATTEVIME